MEPSLKTEGKATRCFEPAERFDGPRVGFAFKLGEKGLGYYLDNCDEQIETFFRKSKMETAYLFELAERGKFERLGGLLEEFPHLWQATESDGTSLLHWAAMRDDAQFVERLVQKGITVDSVGPQRQTPLMWASAAGSVAAMHYLIEAGAEVNARDEQGATPLLHAVQHQQRTALMRLVAAAEPAQLVAMADAKGRSAAHWAAYLGDEASLKLLGQFDLNLHHLDERRNTVLHQAVLGKKPDVLGYLMDKGVDPEIHNADGASCLDLAREAGDDRTRCALERLLKPKGESLESGLSKRDQGVNGKDPTKLLKQYGAGLFWLMCVSITVVEYLLDARPVAYELSPSAALFFELGTCVCLALFFMIALGDPGKVHAAPGRTSAVEAYLGLLRSGCPVDVGRLCTSTWVLKDLRTKYDVMTGACVQEFDHFCNFTGCAIGRGNHRAFLVLAILEPLTQFCYLFICVVVAYRPVGMPQDLDQLLWLPYNMAMHMPSAAMQYPFMALVSILNICTAPPVIYLLITQFFMISMNWTVNEHMNCARYRHFWVYDSCGNRSMASPFNKGSTWENWKDFCWHRRRSEVGPLCSENARSLAAELKKAGAQ